MINKDCIYLSRINLLHDFLLQCLAGYLIGSYTPPSGRSKRGATMQPAQCLARDGPPVESCSRFAPVICGGPLPSALCFGRNYARLI